MGILGETLVRINIDLTKGTPHFYCGVSKGLTGIVKFESDINSGKELKEALEESIYFYCKETQSMDLKILKELVNGSQIEKNIKVGVFSHPRIALPSAIAILLLSKEITKEDLKQIIEKVEGKKNV